MAGVMMVSTNVPDNIAETPGINVPEGLANLPETATGVANTIVTELDVAVVGLTQPALLVITQLTLAPLVSALVLNVFCEPVCATVEFTLKTY